MPEPAVHLRTCSLCEAMCGLEISVEDGRVAGIRPDRDDVWSRGYICPKGAALGDLHDDPDRLRTPLVRDGERWREAELGGGVRRGRAPAPSGDPELRVDVGRRLHRQPDGA